MRLALLWVSWVAPARGDDGGAGAVAQWVRGSGPVLGPTPKGTPGDLTVVDAYATRQSVWFLGTSAALNLDAGLKDRDLRRWFTCAFGAGGAPSTARRASANPSHARKASSLILVECALPAPCWGGAAALRVGAGPLRGADVAVDVARSPACAADDRPRAVDAAFCLAPVYGANLNGALLVEWLEYHLALGVGRVRAFERPPPFGFFSSSRDVVVRRVLQHDGRGRARGHARDPRALRETRKRRRPRLVARGLAGPALAGRGRDARRRHVRNSGAVFAASEKKRFAERVGTRSRTRSTTASSARRRRGPRRGSYTATSTRRWSRRASSRPALPTSARSCAACPTRRRIWSTRIW